MKRLAVLVMLFVLLGCASSGKQIKAEQLQSFEKGRTTLPEVISCLGQPTSKTTTIDGHVVICYNYVQASARPESFIPIVGLFAGGVDSRSNNVTMTFDQQGVLQGYSTTESATGVGTGLFNAGQTPRVEGQPSKAE